MSEEITNSSFEIGKTYIYIPIYDKKEKIIKEERKEMACVTPDEFVSWVKRTCPSLTVEEDNIRTLARRITYFNKVIDTLSLLKLSLPNGDPTKV